MHFHLPKAYSFLLLVVLCYLFASCNLQQESKKTYTIESLNSTQKEAVQLVIDRFKNDERQAIARSVEYPIPQPDPLPDIHNVAEFLEAYDRLFDDAFLFKITNADMSVMVFDMNYQDDVGLFEEAIWVTPEGQIMEINHQSQASLDAQAALHNKLKARMHPNVEDWVENLVSIQDEEVSLRIDSMPDGRLRYLAWNKPTAISDPPDLQLFGARKERRQFYFAGNNQEREVWEAYEEYIGGYTLTSYQNGEFEGFGPCIAWEPFPHLNAVPGRAKKELRAINAGKTLLHLLAVNIEEFYDERENCITEKDGYFAVDREAVDDWYYWMMFSNLFSDDFLEEERNRWHTICTEQCDSLKQNGQLADGPPPCLWEYYLFTNGHDNKLGYQDIEQAFSYTADFQSSNEVHLFLDEARYLELTLNKEGAWKINSWIKVRDR